MKLHNLGRAITGALLVCGLAAVAPIAAQQPSTELPKRAKSIVLVGCFETRQLEHHKPVYVLSMPSVGYATSVPDGRCTSNGSESLVEMKDVHQNTALDDSVLGQWIEVRGRLEKQPTNDSFRELHVRVSRIVPVVAPRAAEAIPELTPRYEPAPAPPQEAAAPPVETPAPVATSGVETPKTLPKTASNLPLVGLLAFGVLVSGACLHLFRRRALL